MKFLIDMPLSPDLAVWLRDQGHDAAHAVDLNLSRATDTAILQRAKSDERTIITADLDYPRLLALTQSTGPSVILFRDGSWSDSEVVKRLGEILRALTAIEIAESIIVVERSRVRRRKLPIA